jgi:hypothetical protein
MLTGPVRGDVDKSERGDTEIIRAVEATNGQEIPEPEVRAASTKADCYITNPRPEVTKVSLGSLRRLCNIAHVDTIFIRRRRRP